jgi:hypothetical protein
MTMGPSEEAGRPSCLVMNPRNREASAARREQLLAAFLALDVNDQADLLEAAESLAFAAAPGTSPYHGTRGKVCRAIGKMYAAAGWEQVT